MALEVAELLTKLTMDTTSFVGGVAKANQESQSMTQKIAGSAAAIGGSMAAVGAVALHFGGAMENANIQLETAVKNSGGSFEELKGKVDDTVKHMQNFGHGTADTETALAKLTTRLNDPNKALADMSVVAEVAATKHISLAAASDIVGKAAQGNSKVLKQFGIVLDDNKKLIQATDKADKEVVTTQDALSTATQKLSDLKAIQATKSKLTIQDQFALRDATKAVKDATDAHAAAMKKAADDHALLASKTANTKDAMTQLGDKLKGVAEGQSKTFEGRMDALKVKLQDFVGTIGQKVGPALVTMGPALAGLGPALGMAGKAFGALKTAAASTFEFLMANPIVLIIAAVVLLAVIIVKNWDTIKSVTIAVFGAVWGFIQDTFNKIMGVVHGVIDWISSNWPFLLAILVGPIGLAVLAIVKNWDTIKAAVQAVWDFIVSAWNAVIGFLTGIPGRIVSAFGDVWAFFRNLWDTMWSGLTGAIDAAIGFLGGIPGRIAGAMGDIWAFFRQGWDTLVGWITGAVSAYIGFWAGVPGRIAGAIGDVFGFFRNLWTTFAGWFGTAWDNEINFWKALPGRIAGAVGDIFGFLRTGIDSAWTYLSGIVDKIVNYILGIPGKLGNLAGTIADKLNPVNALSHLPVIGGIFKAAGGPVLAGQPYITGEKGPELFVPRVPGVIIPHNQLGGTTSLRPMGSGTGGGQTVINNVTVEVAGTVLSEQQLNSRIQDGLKQLVRTTGMRAA